MMYVLCRVVISAISTGTIQHKRKICIQRSTKFKSGVIGHPKGGNEMLSYLEQKRQEVGKEVLNEKGITINADELFSIFREYGKEFETNYILRGHVCGYCRTTIDIEDANIEGVYADWCDRTVRIHRKGTGEHGHYMNALELKTNEMQDARIQVFYSNCDWIDIHISPSEDDFNGAVCLCFPPK